MSKNIKISLFHSVLGLFLSLGMNIYSTKFSESFEEGYDSIFYYIHILPIANFIITYSLWKLLMKRKRRIFLVALLSGIINHFLFFILTYGFSFLNHLFHERLNDLCSCQKDILFGLTSSIYYSFLSLIFLGWLTLILSFISVYVGDRIFKDNVNKINV